MAEVSVTPSTGRPHTAHAPSPKPRNSLSTSKLAAAYEKQATGRPEPFPRKSENCGIVVKDGVPDYVNDPEAVKEVRSAGLAARDRKLASQQHNSPRSTPTLSTARHILKIGRNRSSSDGDAGSSDEEVREYINCASKDRLQQQRTNGRTGVAAEGRTSDHRQRQPVQQASVGTTDEDRQGDFYINCGPNNLAKLEGPKDAAEADSYVEMNPALARKLLAKHAQSTALAVDADNAYVRMNPAPRRPSPDSSQQQHIYQVPTSNRPVSPVDPQSVAGIYEIEPDANPLHPHHQISAQNRVHNSSPLQDSPHRNTISERSFSPSHLTANRRGPRLPLTPPPRIRPPEPRSSSPLTGSPIASGLRNIRSYSIDELGDSPSGRTLRSYSSTDGGAASHLTTSSISGRRDLRPQSIDHPGSTSPVTFNPSPKQHGRKSGPPHLMGSVAGFHGRLTRKLAETRLGAVSGAMNGDYIIRESTNAPPGKMQVVISLKTTSMPMHVIVDYRDGMFWMAASETNQVSFQTMEDLLQHYKLFPIVVDGNGSKVKLFKPIQLRRGSEPF